MIAKVNSVEPCSAAITLASLANSVEFSYIVDLRGKRAKAVWTPEVLERPSLHLHRGTIQGPGVEHGLRQQRDMAIQRRWST